MADKAAKDVLSDSLATKFQLATKQDVIPLIKLHYANTW